jgi:hypothetical protein
MIPNDVEKALLEVEHEYARTILAYKELLFERPEIRNILGRLYRKYGQTKVGQRKVVDKLRELLNDETDSRM